MVERKSKPRHTRKGGEDDEPEGFEALKQNPVFLLVMIILFIIVLVGGIYALAQFLSGGA